MSLEGYLADQYNRDRQDVEAIEKVLADAAAMFAASPFVLDGAWREGYIVNPSSDRAVARLYPSNFDYGWGTHSNPCGHYGCEGETREIVLRIAVISGCDASPVLELAEHSFDEILRL
jgi:hypothetical protein